MTPVVVHVLACVASVPTALLPRALRRAHGEEIRACVRCAVVDAWQERGRRGALGAAWAQCVDLLRAAALERRGAATVRWARLVPLAASALLVLWLSRPQPYYDELVVSAVDPSGPFSLTIRRGQLVAGTLAGEAVPPHRLLQSGRDMRIIAEDGSLLLALTFEPPGVVRWEARSP